MTSKRRKTVTSQEINETFHEPIGEKDVQSFALITVMMMQMLDQVDEKRMIGFLEPHIDKYLTEWRTRIQNAVKKEFSLFEGDSNCPFNGLIKGDVARESKRIQTEVSIEDIRFHLLSSGQLRNLFLKIIKTFEHRAQITRDLYPDYKEYLQSAFVPPLLGSTRPIEKVFQITTTHLSHYELMSGLGLVNRSWYIYMYHNLFLLSRTAETASHDNVFAHRWKVATKRGPNRNMRIPARHLFISGHGTGTDFITAPLVKTIEFTSAETDFVSAHHGEYVEREFALLKRHPLTKTLIFKARYTNCTPISCWQGCDWISKHVDKLIIKMLYGLDNYAIGHVKNLFPLPMKRWPKTIVIETKVPKNGYWLYIERLYNDMNAKMKAGECQGLERLEIVVFVDAASLSILDYFKKITNLPTGVFVSVQTM